MKMKIPRTYKLGAVKNTVELVDKIEHDTLSIMGDWCDEQCRIRLVTKTSKGDMVPHDRLGQAYCHELVHSILDSMGHKLSHDEGFVDAFGRYLHQYMTTQSGVLIVLDD
jgi:hypothetical protein